VLTSVIETYRWKDGKGWEGKRMCCPQTAYGRRTDEGSIGFTLSFVQMQHNCKCNSLLTSFPSHQVSIFTHTCIPFTSPRFLCIWHSALHVRDVTPTRGYNAVAEDCGAGSHLPAMNRHSFPTK